MLMLLFVELTRFSITRTSTINSPFHNHRDRGSSLSTGSQPVKQVSSKQAAMALIFVERNGETFSLFVESGETLEWDAEMIHLTPTPQMLEKIDVKDLMKLVERGGQTLANTLGVNPKKTFIIAQLIVYWTDVRMNTGSTEDKKEKKDKNVKDKGDPLNKLTKIELIQKAGLLKITKTLDGKTIDTRSKNDSIIAAIRKIEPIALRAKAYNKTNTINQSNKAINLSGQRLPHCHRACADIGAGGGCGDCNH
jgi:hypothetical protein